MAGSVAVEGRAAPAAAGAPPPVPPPAAPAAPPVPPPVPKVLSPPPVPKGLEQVFAAARAKGLEQVFSRHGVFRAMNQSLVLR